MNLVDDLNHTLKAFNLPTLGSLIGKVFVFETVSSLVSGVIDGVEYSANRVRLHSQVLKPGRPEGKIYLELNLESLNVEMVESYFQAGRFQPYTYYRHEGNFTVM